MIPTSLLRLYDCDNCVRDAGVRRSQRLFQRTVISSVDHDRGPSLNGKPALDASGPRE
jgi:hypothetical protein